MNRIIRMAELTKMTGLSKSAIFKHVRQRLFPKPIAIGPRAKGWPIFEVEEIIEARIFGKSNAEIKELVSNIEGRRIPKN